MAMKMYAVPFLFSVLAVTAMAVRPENVTCEDPVLNNTHLSLTCRTEKVFAMAGCVFYQHKDNAEKITDASVTYGHEFISDDPDYFKSNCTLTVPLSRFSPGSYSFFVIMYPDVPDGIADGVNSISTLEVLLWTIQLENAAEDMKTFVTAVDSDVYIVVKVCGFPGPQHFSLFSERDSAVFEVTSQKYTATYASLDLACGSVNLALFGIKSTDFVNYILKIDSEYGSVLDYHFTLANSEVAVEHSICEDLCVGIISAIVGIIIVAVGFLLFKRWRRRRALSTEGSLYGDLCIGLACAIVCFIVLLVSILLCRQCNQVAPTTEQSSWLSSTESP